MTGPIELSRARLDRAKEHLDSLDREGPSIMGVCVSDVIHKTHWLDHGAISTHRVCLIVGETVYHLRAALDHIIWGLASKNGQPAHAQVGFPVCESPEHFKQVAHSGLLKGVPRKYYPLIASVQPYLSPDPPNAVVKLLDDLMTADLRHMVKIQLAAVPAAPGISPAPQTSAIVFKKIGSFEQAPILPVLGYIRVGVQGIVNSFEKCFRPD